MTKNSLAETTVESIMSNNFDILQEEIVSIKKKGIDFPVLIILAKGDLIIDVISSSYEELLGTNYQDVVEASLKENKVPCIVKWVDWTKDSELPILWGFQMPLPIIETEKQKKVNDTTVKEVDIEIELYEWLLNRGIECYRQVSNGKKTSRYDIWIPNKFVIEIKRKTVSCADICQSIRYHEETGKKVLLVAKNCNLQASKTIQSFNNLIGDETLSFIDFSNIKHYLKGVFLDD
jgi:hypothetical protein